jgi:hypothetical protein
MLKNRNYFLGSQYFHAYFSVSCAMLEKMFKILARAGVPLIMFFGGQS